MRKQRSVGDVMNALKSGIKDPVSLLVGARAPAPSTLQADDSALNESAPAKTVTFPFSMTVHVDDALPR